MSRKCFGVALFGLGRAGQIRFHNLRNSPRVEILYVVEEDTEKAKQIVQEYRLKEVQVLPPDGSTAALQDSRVEAVVVATPTFTHQQIVMDAVAAGKAVFCEKPIAPNLEETRKCYEAAAKKGVPLFCSFNRRYDPSFRDIYNRVKSGELGKLHLVRTTSRDHCAGSLAHPPSYFALSGGLYHDTGVHDLDLVCWIVGEFPSEVHVFAHAQDPNIKACDDVDTTIIALKFPSGVLASIDISRHANYGYDQRLEVFGQNGMLESQNLRSTAVVSYNNQGTSTEKIMENFPQRYAESYVNSLDNFFDILEGKKAQDITMASVLEITRLASACEGSARTGKNIIMAEYDGNKT